VHRVSAAQATPGNVTRAFSDGGSPPVVLAVRGRIPDAGMESFPRSTSLSRMTSSSARRTAGWLIVSKWGYLAFKWPLKLLPSLSDWQLPPHWG